MQAEIFDRFADLASTEAGQAAADEYIAAVMLGKCDIEAQTMASNVLQRAGYNVNAAGGASFRVASIDHNDEPGVRVSLTLDVDSRGHFVAADGEDTGPRFATAADAFESIWPRWGNGAPWGLVYAGQ